MLAHCSIMSPSVRYASMDVGTKRETYWKLRRDQILPAKLMMRQYQSCSRHSSEVSRDKYDACFAIGEYGNATARSSSELEPEFRHPSSDLQSAPASAALRMHTKLLPDAQAPPIGMMQHSAVVPERCETPRACSKLQRAHEPWMHAANAHERHSCP